MKNEMNAHASADRPAGKSDITGGVLKRLRQVAAGILIQAAILFIASARLDWLMAWAYVGVYVGVVAVNTLIILPRNAELIAERGQPSENANVWDKQLSGPTGLASVVALVVAGLDMCMGWSPQFSLAFQLIALAISVLGYAMFSWAMASNPFFSRLVRIQAERGHAVASAGPYRIVRHPGYVGWIILSIATPLMLDSLWGVIPGGVSALLMAFRTALEDKTLLAELDGYQDYAQTVRYPLLPGVW